VNKDAMRLAGRCVGTLQYVDEDTGVENEPEGKERQGSEPNEGGIEMAGSIPKWEEVSHGRVAKGRRLSKMGCLG
jgi:hypothetical protein